MATWCGDCTKFSWLQNTCPIPGKKHKTRDTESCADFKHTQSSSGRPAMLGGLDRNKGENDADSSNVRGK